MTPAGLQSMLSITLASPRSRNLHNTSWWGAGAVVIAVSSATGRGNRHGWLPDDLNNGRLDLFFLFLAGQSHAFTMHTL